MAIQELINDLNNRPDFLSPNFGPADYAVPGGTAEKIVKELIANKKENGELKATQLRKVFAEVRRIESKAKLGESFENDLARLMPQIAYALGRKLIPKSFYDLLKACVIYNERIRFSKAKRDDFLEFVKFFEAIVAYYKINDKKIGDLK